jgi:hypothetical protein
MASVRIRGISAKIDNKKTLFEKARKINTILGDGYKIIIDKNNLSIEGDILDDKIKKKIVDILSS